MSLVVILVRPGPDRRGAGRGRAGGGDPQGPWTTHACKSTWAWCSARTGRGGQALAAFEESIPVLAAAGDTRFEALALNCRGIVHGMEGRYALAAARPEARRRAERTRRLSAAERDRAGEPGLGGAADRRRPGGAGPAGRRRRAVRPARQEQRGLPLDRADTLLATGLAGEAREVVAASITDHKRNGFMYNLAESHLMHARAALADNDAEAAAASARIGADDVRPAAAHRVGGPGALGGDRGPLRDRRAHRGPAEPGHRRRRPAGRRRLAGRAARDAAAGRPHSRRPEPQGRGRIPAGPGRAAPLARHRGDQDPGLARPRPARPVRRPPGRGGEGAGQRAAGARGEQRRPRRDRPARPRRRAAARNWRRWGWSWPWSAATRGPCCAGPRPGARRACGGGRCGPRTTSSWPTTWPSCAASPRRSRPPRRPRAAGRSTATRCRG